MMEINLYRDDEEVLSQLKDAPDPQIDRHLLKIRQLTTKLRASAHKSKVQQAIDQINALRKLGLAELNNFLNPDQQRALSPLFNKFKELTSEDEKSLLQDQELLRALEILKKKLDEDSKN
jgi:hypothetical protein